MQCSFIGSSSSLCHGNKPISFSKTATGVWVGEGCWGNGTGGRGEKEFTVKSISLNVLFTAQTLPGFIFNSAIHISDGKQEPRFT